MSVWWRKPTRRARRGSHLRADVQRIEGRRSRPAFPRMKTYSPKPRDIERRWYVIDASGAVLGRLATEAAAILRGKHKPIFAPHMDTGDHVIVVNAKGVQITGGKGE